MVLICCSAVDEDRPRGRSTSKAEGEGLGVASVCVAVDGGPDVILSPLSQHDVMAAENKHTTTPALLPPHKHK